MIKKSKSISINILSVFIILTCLLLSLVAPTNAWFTDKHEDGIYITVEVGNLNFKLYQITTVSGNPSEREVYSRVKNTKHENDDDANTTMQFIEIDGVIEPVDENETDAGGNEKKGVLLNLELRNEDEGETSVYIRYKFQLMTRGVTEDKEIPVNIHGFTEATATTKGFIKGDEAKGEDSDYYYYKESSLSDAGYALFAKNTVVTILENFKVPYSSFVDNNGNMLIKNSETVYIKLTIEESADGIFVEGE